MSLDGSLVPAFRVGTPVGDAPRRSSRRWAWIGKARSVVPNWSHAKPEEKKTQLAAVGEVTARRMRLI